MKTEKLSSLIKQLKEDVKADEFRCMNCNKVSKISEVIYWPAILDEDHGICKACARKFRKKLGL